MKVLIFLFFISFTLFGVEIKNEKNIELADIQKNDIEANKAMNNWLDGVFGLQPYKVNYLMPYAYRETAYKSYDSVEYKNIEAELQVSLKLGVGSNLFGLNEKYYLSYSHKAFWQIYTESSPFRETNYNPEAFVVFPVFDKTSMFQLRSLKFAIAHNSNGQPESHNEALYTYHYEDPQNMSRSLNYIYAEATLQHDTLVTGFKIQARLPEAKETDDNPNIMEYMGFTEVKLTYFLHKHVFTMVARGNIMKGQGALETTYSYPLLNDTYVYAKIFTGYGESLIDYDNYITKFAIGFSFSR